MSATLLNEYGMVWYPRSEGWPHHGRSLACFLRWRRGVVVSGDRRMNEVNARRARLVPGWVTVFGRVYRLCM